MNSRRRTGLLAVVATVALSSPTFAAPRVVVTIKPIHALVSGIMNGVGTPTLLVEGTASPHTFTLRPSTARAVNEADIFVRVSESVEPFTVRLARALPDNVRLVTLDEMPGLVLRDQRDGLTFESHGHAASAPNADSGGRDAAEPHRHGHRRDGHIWLDPENAKRIVAGLASVLAQRDPANAAKYKANAARVTARIDDLSAGIAREMKPLAGKPYIVFHDAYQYFEKRFGLEAVGSITVSPEAKPSAKRLTELRHKISALDAVCVFAEPMFQPKLVDAVIEGTDARAGTLDPEGATVPAGPDAYVELMRKLAAGLTSCLSGEPSSRAELPAQ
jgi:zinc transport system substrate-binding protein